MRGGGRESYQKNVEEGIPVAGGGDVALASTNFGFKAPELGRRWIPGKGSDPTRAKHATREGGAYDGVATNIIGDKEISDVTRDAQSSPRETKEQLVHAVERTFYVP